MSNGGFVCAPPERAVVVFLEGAGPLCCLAPRPAKMRSCWGGGRRYSPRACVCPFFGGGEDAPPRFFLSARAQVLSLGENLFAATPAESRVFLRIKGARENFLGGVLNPPRVIDAPGFSPGC